MFENIPTIMKENGLFCGWKLTERGKIPFNIRTGQMARSNDRTTFVPFAEAEKSIDSYYSKNREGALTGGLGLGIFNGFSAVDIDHCVENGKPNQFAQGIIDYFSSYTEFSPSGTGIRIIFRTKTKVDKATYYINNSKLGLEIYVEGSTAKFVTITGNMTYSYLSNIVDLDDIKPVLDQYMKKPEASKPVETSCVSTAEFNLDRALQNDKKLAELWYSKAPGSGSNENQLDLGLCSKLAFYCQRDEKRINDLFMSSPYFHSKDNAHTKKWIDREDYRVKTIKMACDGCQQVYNPAGNVSKPVSKEMVDSRFDYTDTGNAMAFVQSFGKTIRYNRDNKSWMIWNGLYWQTDVLDRIRVLADDFIDNLKSNSDKILYDKDYRKNIERLLSTNGKDSMLKEAQHIPGIPVTNSDFDKDIYKINCRSGVIDLRTGKIEQPSPSLMQSKFCNCAVTDRKPETFIKFLDSTFSGNKNVIDYLMTVFSICLTGDISETKMWYFVGEGADGKSVLVKTISTILGDYASTASTDLIVDKKFQSQNITELARLKGKRFVSVSETKTDDRLDEAGVKNMTGGDSVVARFLYCNEFEYTPEFKIVMMSNYEPKIVGNDNGIRRRIKIIRFPNSVPEDKQDKHLFEKLIKEKDGIFSMLLDYYRVYKEKGLVEPEEVKDLTEDYFKSNDIIQQWIDEDCLTGKGFHDYANNLWGDFKIWYDKRNEFFRYSQTLFGRNLSKKFHKATQFGKVAYEGVQVK